MPDGAYYLKIIASDALSNPPDLALQAERESDRFEVDNTTPTHRQNRIQPNRHERGPIKGRLLRLQVHRQPSDQQH